jgi:integrase
MPKLTSASVAKYQPKATRREIPDSAAPGLFLIVQPSGRKSWAVRLRRPSGACAKLTLGCAVTPETETGDDAVTGAALTLGQARELAAAIDRKRQRGIDVVAERKADKARQQTAAADRASNGFAAAAIEFLVEHKVSANRGGQRPRRWREIASALGLRYPLGADPATVKPEVIKGGLAEIWADKPVADIDSHIVHVVVDQARRYGNDGRARKLCSALSVLFSWLQQRRRVTTNPATGVYRPGPPPSRERVLSPDEIRVFWKAADRVGGAGGALAKLLLITGARLREVSGMTRAELADDGTWTVPPNRTKNYRPLTLPLPQLALDVIASAPRIGDVFVFTSNGRRAFTNASGLKTELDAAMAEIAGRPVEPWRLHDMRRSCATGMAALGVALPTIERLLNHTSGSFKGVAGIYQRYEFADEKAEALRRWAMHLQGLVADKPNNVAVLHRRRDAGGGV